MVREFIHLLIQLRREAERENIMLKFLMTSLKALLSRLQKENSVYKIHMVGINPECYVSNSKAVVNHSHFPLISFLSYSYWTPKSLNAVL